jgi:hypothetical protein
MAVLGGGRERGQLTAPAYRTVPEHDHGAVTGLAVPDAVRRRRVVRGRRHVSPRLGLRHLPCKPIEISSPRGLEAAGGELLYREYPLDHSLDPGFLADVRVWLAEQLARDAD